MSEQELREKIATEIESINLDEAKTISSDWFGASVRMRMVCASIARIGLESVIPEKTINDINKENVESDFSSTDENAQPLTPTQKAGQS